MFPLEIIELFNYIAIENRFTIVPFLERLYIFKLDKNLLNIFPLQDLNLLKNTFEANKNNPIFTQICAIQQNKEGIIIYYDKYLNIITEKEFWKLIKIWKINQIIS